MFDPAAFSSDFELEATEPEPEPAPEPPDEEGPWISHGVIHLAKPPSNH